MLRRCVLALSLAPAVAFAGTKPEPVYQDATLVNFHTERTGSSCTHRASTDGRVNAYSDGYGNTNGTLSAETTGSSSCSNITRAFYLIESAGHRYTLTPELSGVQTGALIATAGFGAFFIKHSSLYGQLPGSQVKIRSDTGTFYVKAGKRETRYRLVGAE